MKPVLLVQGIKAIEEVPGLDALRDEAEIRMASSVDELRAGLPGSEVLLGWDFRADNLRQAWDSVDELRWMHWAGAGVDAAMFDELVNSDVTLTNARGVFDQPIAEWVLGRIIGFAKRFHESFADQARAEWCHRMSEQVTGKHALVVGVGSIGRAIGRLLAAAGMEVEAIGRSARDDDTDFGRVHGIDALNELLPQADYVVLITPLTAQTRGLFAAPQFAAMKSTARFINVGRGALVEEPDLLAALNDGAIAGAALDVFAEEPLPASSPFWTAPNCVVSPHMSGDYLEFESAMAQQFLANWKRYRMGETLNNRIDKALGFAAR